MKSVLLGVAAAVGLLSYAQAQTLTVMVGVDIAHHDPARTDDQSVRSGIFFRQVRSRCRFESRLGGDFFLGR